MPIFSTPEPGTQKVESKSLGTFYVDPQTAALPEDQLYDLLKAQAGPGLLEFWKNKVTEPLSPEMAFNPWKALTGAIGTISGAMTGPQQYYGKKLGEKLSDLLPSDMTVSFMGPPETPQTVEERRRLFGAIGETLGSFADPLAIPVVKVATKVGKFLTKAPKPIPAIVEAPVEAVGPLLVRKKQPAEVARLLEAVEKAQYTTNPTLQAAENFATGRTLDFGTVGRARKIAQEGAHFDPLPKFDDVTKPLVEVAPARTAADVVADAKTTHIPDAKNVALRQFYTNPSRIDDPAFQEVFSRGLERRETREKIIRSLDAKAAELATQVPSEELPAVLRALGEGGDVTMLSETGQSTAAGFRKYLDDMWRAYGDVEDAPPYLEQYFPKSKVKESFAVQEKGIVPTESGGYYGRATLEELPKKWRPFMLKERTADTEAIYDLDALRILNRAAADRIATSGGKMPFTEEVVEGFIPRITREGSLGRVAPENVEYAAEYLNNILGATPPKSGVIDPKRTANLMRLLNLAHLSFNPGAAIGNMTQVGLTASKVAPSSTVEGLADYIGLLMKRGGRRVGLASDELSGSEQLLSRFGLEQPTAGFAGVDAKSVLEPGILSKVSRHNLFGASQKFTEETAALIASREAKRRGLSGEAFDDAVRRTLVDTQQWGLTENMPLAWQTMSPGWRIVAQYKNFPRQYLNFLGQTVKEDTVQAASDIKAGLSLQASEHWAEQLGRVKNATTTYERAREIGNLADELPFANTAKFILGTVAIGGADAISLGYGDKVSEFVTGDPDSPLLKGLLPTLGIYAGSMVGLGVLPFASLRNLAYTFTPAAAGTILDAASAATSLISGKDWDFNAKNLAAFIGQGGSSVGTTYRGPQANEAKVVGNLVENLPVIGGPLSNIAQAHRNYVTPGSEVRTPLTLGDLLGPLDESRHALYPKATTGAFGENQQVVNDLLGFRHPDQVKLMDLNREFSQRAELMKLDTGATVKRAAETGDLGKALELLESLGLISPSTPQTLKEAFIRNLMPPQMRMYRDLPLPLRGEYLQRSQPR